MELERAQNIAEGVVGGLEQYCSRIQVAGSIRRKAPNPKDIDLVLIPQDRDALDRRLMQLGQVKMSGLKIARVQMDSIPLDIYFATRETFGTLLLIRTGSAENNVRLATLAKTRGWHLYASGEGLFNERDEKIADDEVSIYKALNLRYEEPWERG